MAYCVYENWRRSKAKVHFAGCGFCNHGKGIHTTPISGNNDRWHGPFKSVQEAISVAKDTGQPVSSCKKCNPY